MFEEPRGETRRSIYYVTSCEGRPAKRSRPRVQDPINSAKRIQTHDHRSCDQYAEKDIFRSSRIHRNRCNKTGTMEEMRRRGPRFTQGERARVAQARFAPTTPPQHSWEFEEEDFELGSPPECEPELRHFWLSEPHQ